MKTLIAILALASLAPAASFAADPNFLTPSDLPPTAYQIFSVSGRGKAPSFPPNYGIEEALRSNFAQRSCMAKVGKQLTPFESTLEASGFYFTYTISAKFECLAPQEETTLPGAESIRLIQALQGKTHASVLCYDFYEEVCDGPVLIRYKTHEKCEIEDSTGSSPIVTLEDISDREPEQVQGASALNRQLPVVSDGRRDDTPGGNCQPHQYGKLKGLSRKSAKINCSTSSSKAPICTISGIIEPK
jgi:hypothetical protein